MIASPRPKIFDSRFAKPLRIRGLKEGRLMSRLTLTQVVSPNRRYLSQRRLPARETGDRVYFTVTVSTGSFAAERDGI